MIKLRALLTEAPEDELATVYGKGEKGKSVAKGQAQLAKIISDPKVQAVLKAGLEDGDLNDDKLPYKREFIAVTELQPTQNEIGFDQSVLNNLTNKFGKLDTFLKGKPNVNGPIVTYAGKYIIDGHHRWSSVFAVNPKAKMLTLNIKGNPNFSHTDILKAVHGAIAADLGKVPEANPKGINLLKGVTIDQIPINMLEDKVFEIYQQYSPMNVGASGKMDINGPEDVQTAIFENLKFMIKNGVAAGAPGRKHMPQSDSGGEPIDRLGALSRGEINVEEPFGSVADGVIKMKNLLGK